MSRASSGSREPGAEQCVREPSVHSRGRRAERAADRGIARGPSAQPIGSDHEGVRTGPPVRPVRTEFFSHNSYSVLQTFVFVHLPAE
jgi:hypothetical protein